MRVFVRLLCAALLCAACAVPASAVSSDESAAQRALGPQWKQLSRRAGIVFAGTVLGGRSQAASIPTASLTTAKIDRDIPAVELTFRVDHAIAGVDAGQVLKIHEWVGAQSLHRPMHAGEHILIFLYAPSHLGLTSPVGGSRGQIALDSSGQYVDESKLPPQSRAGGPQSPDIQPAASKQTRNTITVIQLARAIRAARGE